MWKVKENSKEKIRSIFSEACAKAEMFILNTKYCKTEAHFVKLDGNEVHIKATAGGERVLTILGHSDINLRFPNNPGYVDVNTKLIGPGAYEGDKTIKFALPPYIYVCQGRRSPRITHLEGVYAAFGFGDNRSFRTDVVDLSITGAKLTIVQGSTHRQLKQNDRISLSIHLSKDISIYSGAIVRHVDYSTFGVEFSPDLADSDITAILDWFHEKQEKVQKALTNCEDIDADATAIMEESLDEYVILLVTNDDELGVSLNQLLGNGRTFYCVAPDTPQLLDALDARPNLVIFHLSGDTIEKLTLKSLIESIPSETPVLLLGTEIDDDLLFELRLLFKAVTCEQWAPKKGRFLQQLVSGILRKKSQH